MLIRNPWGFKEWTGEWSDNSVKWKQFPEAQELIAAQLRGRREGTLVDQYLQRDDKDG